MLRGAYNFPPNPTPPVQPQPIPMQPFQQPEPDDDVEVVPETQPAKGKGKLNKGNNQTGDGFWSKVLAKFLELMDQGPYRDIDSVSSKWRKLNSAVNRFCEEYNKIYTSGRRSGMSDDDVFKKALDNYKNNNGNTNFAHVRAWEIMKKEPKWSPTPNEVEMAKRQKHRKRVALAPVDRTREEYAVHEAERPPGRDKSKKERAKGKEKEKVDPNMVEFMEHLKMYNDISAQKTKSKERAVEEKTRVPEEKLREKVRLSNEKIRISDEKIRLKEWDIIISMNVEDEPEPKRSMLKKLQHDIMKKHQII
ncbi:uncharacterized protein LOC110876975 [Helianthus annuus]|uniref:uncharacterized protein LOC110876975 n=1 Tax=Helianthus annuus TaxID=4232 RepID=UPI000B8F36B8|nr:uncharacterized protein LOC110876975 [Helianthus annuus]